MYDIDFKCNIWCEIPVQQIFKLGFEQNKNIQVLRIFFELHIKIKYNLLHF